MAATDITTIKVLIVDNHELVRTFLTVDLSRYTGLEVVGTAADGLQAITLTRQLKPDVILMDLQMPVMDGLTASGHIKVDFPDIKIITSLDDPQTEVIAQSVPIDKFCYKDAKTEALVELIRQCKSLDQSQNYNGSGELKDERY
jgi:DNA-binding NarL/FixJ family response regulator